MVRIFLDKVVAEESSVAVAGRSAWTSLAHCWSGGASFFKRRIGTGQFFAFNSLFCHLKGYIRRYYILIDTNKYQ